MTEKGALVPLVRNIAFFGYADTLETDPLYKEVFEAAGAKEAGRRTSTPSFRAAIRRSTLPILSPPDRAESTRS